MHFLVEHNRKYIQGLHLKPGWLTEKVHRWKGKGNKIYEIQVKDSFLEKVKSTLNHKNILQNKNILNLNFGYTV